MLKIYFKEDTFEQNNFTNSYAFWKTFFPEITCSEDILQIIFNVTGRSYKELKDDLETLKVTHIEVEKVNEINLEFAILVTGAMEKINHKICGWKAFFMPFLISFFTPVYEYLIDCNIIELHNDIFVELCSNVTLSLFLMSYRVLALETNLAREKGMLLGESSEERALYFKEKLLGQKCYLEVLYNKYYALVVLVKNKLEQVTNFIIEILENYKFNEEALSLAFNNGQSFGKIKSIYFDAGDTHNGGKSVAIVFFDTGEKLVYKPRNMSIEKNFNKFIDWINSNSKEEILKMKTAAIHTGNAHGWSQFVTSQNCIDENEVRNYYIRIGQLLAIFYLLGSRDLHYENIIAAGEYPIIIDLETLFCPELSGFPKEDGTIYHKISKIIYKSVRASAILPINILNRKNRKSVDLSGLSSKKNQQSPYESVYLTDVNTDNIRVVYGFGEIANKDNSPKTSGLAKSSSDFTFELKYGFGKMYMWLMNNRLDIEQKIVDLFDNLNYRLLFRSTPTYAQLLATSLHPSLLQSCMDREIYFHRLGINAVPEYREILNAEYIDMLNFDVPYFLANVSGLDIVDSRGKSCNLICRLSAMELVKEKLNRLSYEDLNLQLSIINYSFMNIEGEDIYKTNCKFHRYPSKEFNSNNNIEIAEKIADYIMSNSISMVNDGEKHSTWIGSIEIPDLFKEVAPVGTNLYSGNAGIAIFFACLAVIKQNPKYKDYALQTICPVVDYLKKTNIKKETQIGGFDGFFGILYCIDIVSKLLNKNNYREIVQKHLTDASSISFATNQHDIITGNAGALAILLSLEDEDLLPIKYWHRMYEHLLCEIEKLAIKDVDNSWYWGTNGYTGYSHGNAGISPLIFELSRRLRRPQIKDWVKRILQFERKMYDKRKNNWKRGILDSSCNVNWCHGASGILLSRLQLYEKGYIDKELLDEIDIAIETIKKLGFGYDMCLCHGDFGNLLVLSKAATILKNLTLKNQVNSTANEVAGLLNKRLSSGHYDLRANYSMMTGLSGAGYALLYLNAEEGQLPEILTLS